MRDALDQGGAAAGGVDVVLTISSSLDILPAARGSTTPLLKTSKDAKTLQANAPTKHYFF